jgi:hypothetical protein
VYIDGRLIGDDKHLLFKPLAKYRRRAGVLVIGIRVLGQLAVVLYADEVVTAAVVKLVLKPRGDDVVGGTDYIGQLADYLAVIVNGTKGPYVSHIQ